MNSEAVLAPPRAPTVSVSTTLLSTAVAVLFTLVIIGVIVVLVLIASSSGSKGRKRTDGETEKGASEDAESLQDEIRATKSRMEYAIETEIKQLRQQVLEMKKDASQNVPAPTVAKIKSMLSSLPPAKRSRFARALESFIREWKEDEEEPGDAE
jgi:hypothetical protein